MDDIEAVVVGKAPDFFEGVMMPELFLADALGAVGEPLLRVHTAGSVGGLDGDSRRQPRPSRSAQTRAGRRLGQAVRVECDVGAAIPIPFNMPVNAGAGGYFAPHVRSYIRRSGAPNYIGAIVAARDRQNGAKNPFAHLHQPEITVESVQASQMLWDFRSMHPAACSARIRSVRRTCCASRRRRCR